MEENQRIYTIQKTIEPNSFYYDSFLTGEMAKDAPFKNIIINNGFGAADVRVYFNGQEHGVRINSGAIFTFSDEKISSIKIENLDSSNNAEIEFTIDNKLTEKEILKNLLFLFSEVKK